MNRNRQNPRTTVKSAAELATARVCAPAVLLIFASLAVLPACVELPELMNPFNGGRQPPGLNQPPIAAAGLDQTVSGRKPVTLDGGASNDPDGDALTYAWSQIAGPTVTLSQADTPHPTFNAPAVDHDTVLQFELTVSDGSATDRDTVTVTITPPRVTISAAWEDSTDTMHADITWRLPFGDLVPINREGWSLEGIESVSRPMGLIEDGLHWLELELHGDRRATALKYDMDFLEAQFHVDERRAGPLRQAIALDVQDGVPHVVFNGRLPASHADSGCPSGLHNVEILAGWREADKTVHADINLLQPNGAWVDVWRHGWAFQGFERAFIPAAVPLADGLYRLYFELHGSGRTADVVYDVQFLDLRFRVDQLLPGNYSRTIGVDLVDGEPHVIFNGWLDADEDGAGALTGRRPLEVVTGWREASDSVHADINVILPCAGINRRGVVNERVIR